MAEYIEREAVMQAFTDYVWNSNHSDLVPAPTWNHAVDIVRDIPAADVVGVRHGRWMTTEGFPHRVYCSCCYSTYVPNDNWQIWQDKFGEGGLPRDYCPNCGAKMDGGMNDAAD